MSGAIRVVVAGAGAFGREHMRILASVAGAALAGVADRNAAGAAEAAARYGAGAHGPDAAELIERLRPDAVIVATPGATHVPIAAHALGLGIPVLLEKPVAPSAAEADELAAAAGRSGAFVMPGHILRFSEPHRRLAEMVAGIGPVTSFTSRRHRDDGHATRYADDPVLMTMVHDIDLAGWMTGAVTREVLAWRQPAGARSETLMMARDSKDGVWRLSTAWTFPAASQPPDRVEVIGEAGAAELEAGAYLRCFGARPQRIDISAADPDQPHRDELAHFLDCVRSGRKPTVVTLADARAGLATADAVRASLVSGRLERG
jgi:predicted dehydrogenase